MAPTKQPKKESQATETSRLDNEKLQRLVNEIYLTVCQQLPDERDQAAVFAAVSATFLMNISNDQDFHDEVLSVMIHIMCDHPEFSESVQIPNGGNGKVH